MLLLWLELEEELSFVSVFVVVMVCKFLVVVVVNVILWLLLVMSGCK